MAFFAFDPISLRRRLYAAAAGGAAVVAWASVGLVQGTERFAAARVIVGAALVLAMGSLAWRLRRRPGYGIKVEPTTMVFARPLSGVVALAAYELSSVALRGARGSSVLEVTLRDGRRILVPRALFASDESFVQVRRALEEASPPPGYHA